MSYKKIHPLTVVMKGKISYIDQNVLHQAVNMFFSAVKLAFYMGSPRDWLPFAASL